MEEEKKLEEIPSRGNDWEVVSLTASTYAAAPGPDGVKSTEDDGSNKVIKDESTEDDGSNKVIKDEEETSCAMFMSRHFVFPPNQHENLPLEPADKEVLAEFVVDVVGPNEFSSLDDQEENISEKTTEENLNIEETGVRDVVHGIAFFDESGKSLSVDDTDFETNKDLHEMQMVVEEQLISSAFKLSSVRDEANISGPIAFHEKLATPEPTSPRQLNSPSYAPTTVEENNSNEPGLPCEAWWKRHAAALYAQAKEANTFWSVFVAAALMGLVILGQRWQQERWQAQQMKLHLNISEEKGNWMMGSISRFKDVLVGGHRRGSIIKGSASAEL